MLVKRKGEERKLLDTAEIYKKIKHSYVVGTSKEIKAMRSISTYLHALQTVLLADTPQNILLTALL